MATYSDGDRVHVRPEVVKEYDFLRNSEMLQGIGTIQHNYSVGYTLDGQPIWLILWDGAVYVDTMREDWLEVGETT